MYVSHIYKRQLTYWQTQCCVQYIVKRNLRKIQFTNKRSCKKSSIFYKGFRERCIQIAKVYSKENNCSLKLAILKLSAYQLDEESSLLFLLILT